MAVIVQRSLLLVRFQTLNAVPEAGYDGGRVDPVVCGVEFLHRSSLVVMYIVDFQRAAYYQKCYDPDCQGYRSPLRPVPWDVIPEHSSIVDSARAEYQMEARDICFDHNEIIEYQGDGKSMTDSGHKDYIWWQEAVRFADSIERMEHPLGSCNLDDDSCEDSEWWIDAEKLVSQIEGRITSQSNV